MIANSLSVSSKNSQDILSKKFCLHQQWLQNELLVMKELILQNPRENISTHTHPNPLFIEAIDDIPEPTSGIERVHSQKRKSPDIPLTKESPNQKRNSVNSNSLPGKVHVPSDLNKLTKEVILIELGNFGITHLTMKEKKIWSMHYRTSTN